MDTGRAIKGCQIPLLGLMAVCVKGFTGDAEEPGDHHHTEDMCSDQTQYDTVAAILHSIWTGQSIAFILPLPTFFLREPIMYGPGRYVPDPTEGMTNVKDLPAPQRVAYHRDHQQTACPRCGHLASRHTSGQRT